MKVTVDISAVPYQRGVSYYTSNLVRALNNHPHIDLTLFGFSLRQLPKLQQFASTLNISKKNIHLWKLPPKLVTNWWYELSLLSPGLFLPKSEIFHAWEEAVPDLSDRPIVVTIHDLAILKYPETAHPDTLYKHSRGWQRIKDLHLHVIAVSKATKKDIIDLLDIPKERVHLIYEALPEERALQLTEAELQEYKVRLQLTKPFILFVGTREPRKNLNRLIEAWQPLAEDYDLVIAGEEGWETLNEEYTHQPRLLGRVKNKELVALYRHAEVFAYPSLYEGFGLPILEAYHHGTPVVTSNVSAMPEVAGNAAELVDPLDVKSITKGLKKVLKETAEQRRQRKQQMKLRLQLFSWEKVAEQTVTVYQQALKDFHSES